MASTKYTRLSNKDEPTFNFKSAFEFEKNTEANDRFRSINTYNANWKYSEGGRNVVLNVDPEEEREPGDQPAKWLQVTSVILTVLSYLFFFLTSPVSYWFMVKKMGTFERIVIFRLGKMIGVKGPGRVIVFPWMDRTKKVDVRASAFAVPPQQLITADGGIVEMGAEIQYTIVDVVTMISEVADHQEILRSLGKTLLVKTLVKKTIQQLERDKRIPAGEIQDEVNDQVRKWGIDIQSVTLSEPKILKQSENSSSSAVGSILKGLGMKGETKYPSPEEFVRTTHGLDPDRDPHAMQSVNMSMLQMLSSGTVPSGVNSVHLGPGAVQAPIDNSPRIQEIVCNWGKCLEVILNSELSGPVEEDAQGLYQIEISETETGNETYFIHIDRFNKSITTINQYRKTPDVIVNVSSPDLGSILEGSLAPLQAYLTGRLSATGDVKKLMFFDKLSKKGHKSGAMFNI